MTQDHIDFHKNPMKVILATQTLSHRTANAIEYLMNKGYSAFTDAGATIEYIRMCADSFAVFNSTESSERNENPLRKMISRNNAAQIFECFHRVERYMRGLQVRTPKGRLVPLCTSQLKTAFVGCIMNIRSFTNLYNELILGHLLSYIPTHSLSQDHLEVSCIYVSNFIFLFFISGILMYLSLKTISCIFLSCVQWKIFCLRLFLLFRIPEGKVM